MVDGRIRRREPYSKLLTRLVPGFNCFDVITDAAQIPLHHVPVSFLYIATDIAEDLLSGPDIVMDVLEALFEHGSLIIEIVCILQVPCHHHHESLFVCEQVQSLERVLHLCLSYYLLHKFFDSLLLYCLGRECKNGENLCHDFRK